MKSNEELNKERIELKEKYGKFNEITVFLEEDNSEKTATLFLRKPDKTCRRVVGELASKNGMKAIEAAIRNTYIEGFGDKIEDVVNNDYALASAEESIVEMLAVQKATLKKN
jgi:hypothetical protein